MTDQSDRKSWLGLLARTEAGELASLWEGHGPSTETKTLRSPEIGSVMVRGRMGATGQPFNLGEMTVTRCSVELTGKGIVGHGYVQGRNRDHARIAATIDALMQTEAAPNLRTAILDPLARKEADARRTRAEKAAATKVDFFTLVRGEDT